MRVRLLRNVTMAGASSVELLAGTIANATQDVADKWIRQGMAMEDKSMDGGSELKEPQTTSPLRPPVRRKRKAKRG